MPKYPKTLMSAIDRVTALRPKRVLQHILEHGSVTTQELRDIYGYNHPPRAARDVREQGIPLRTESVEGPDGRRIARYSIDVDAFQGHRVGRRPLPASFKRDLIEERGMVCEVCLATFDSPLRLQVDHRIPYEIAGDPDLSEKDAFMLVCAPCNRTKSWQCEHCPNWSVRDPSTCGTCFWARPASYEHVATLQVRSVTLFFTGDQENGVFDELAERAKRDGIPLAEVIKKRLRNGG